MMGHSVTSASLLMLEKWEEHLVHQMGVLTSRGTSRGWRNGLTGTSCRSTKGSANVLHLGRNNCRHQYMLGADQLASCFAAKYLGFWWMPS